MSEAREERELRARDAEIARAMDTEPALLPLLPELLADFDSLGSDLGAALELAERAGVGPNSRALDLGSGKGAFAVALAKRGAVVAGVDAFTPFIDAARQAAADAGVADRCMFWRGDLRDALTCGPLYDLVSMQGVGAVMGDLGESIAAMRVAVRPSGHMLIEDAILRDAVDDPPAGYEACPTLEGARALLESQGDRVVAERLFTPEESQAAAEHDLARIRSRAEGILRRRPFDGPLIQAYIEQQAREYAILATVAAPALWLVQKVD